VFQNSLKIETHDDIPNAYGIRNHKFFKKRFLFIAKKRGERCLPAKSERSDHNGQSLNGS